MYKKQKSRKNETLYMDGLVSMRTYFIRNTMLDIVSLSTKNYQQIFINIIKTKCELQCSIINIISKKYFYEDKSKNIKHRKNVDNTSFYEILIFMLILLCKKYLMQKTCTYFCSLIFLYEIFFTTFNVNTCFIT